MFSSINRQLVDSDSFFSGILIILSTTDRNAFLMQLLAEYRDRGIEIAFDSKSTGLSYGIAWQPLRVLTKLCFSVCDIALVTFDDEQQIWADKHHKTL